MRSRTYKYISLISCLAATQRVHNFSPKKHEISLTGKNLIPDEQLSTHGKTAENTDFALGQQRIGKVKKLHLQSTDANRNFVGLDLCYSEVYPFRTT